MGKPLPYYRLIFLNLTSKMAPTAQLTSEKAKYFIEYFPFWLIAKMRLKQQLHSSRMPSRSIYIRRIKVRVLRTYYSNKSSGQSRSTGVYTCFHILPAHFRNVLPEARGTFSE